MTPQPYSGNPYSTGYPIGGYYAALMVKTPARTPSKREAPTNPEDFAFWWLAKIIEAGKTGGRLVK